jgi:hypothetical protein
MIAMRMNTSDREDLALAPIRDGIKAVVKRALGKRPRLRLCCAYLSDGSQTRMRISLSISSILCPNRTRDGGFFEKDGDWNDALYPIGNDVKRAIEKTRLR